MTSDKPKYHSFSGRLTRRIVLLMLAIMAIISGFSLLFTLAGMRTMTDLHCKDLLQLTNERVSSMLNAVQVSTINNVDEVSKHLKKPEDVFDAMESELRLNPHIIGSALAFVPDFFPSEGHWFEPYVLRKEGAQFERSQIGSASHDYFQSDWYRGALESPGGYWSDPFFDEAGAKAMICTFAVPVKAQDGAAVGVYTSDLSLDWLDRELRELAFEEADPARTAAREHGMGLQFARCEALEEFTGFLHDGQVRSESGVIDVIEAELMQRRTDASHGGILPLQAERFSPGGPHCRGDLDEGDFVRVGQSLVDLLRIIPLAQARSRTVSDALPAERAVGILDDPVVRHIDGRAAARARNVPDVHGLDLVADLDAAHAFDAFLVIPVERECRRESPAQPFGQLHFKGGADDAQIVGNLLELAVAAADTVGTVAVVLGEDQLHVDPARFAGPRGMGMDHHAFPDGTVAGGDHGMDAFDFDTADAAGRDFIDVFEIAQVRDVDMGGRGRFEDRRVIPHRDLFSVDRERYHSVSLPPLKLPKP